MRKHSISLLLLTISTLSCGADLSERTSTSPAHPLVGNLAPDFGADSANGRGKFSIRANRGRVLLVDFWATWCGPCRKSFPKFQALNVKYKASGLEVIGVSEDDVPDEIKAFGSSLGTEFPLVWDSGKKIAGKWDPKSMPATFVVDRKGVVRFAHVGYYDGDEAVIEKEIKSLL